MHFCATAPLNSLELKPCFLVIQQKTHNFLATSVFEPEGYIVICAAAARNAVQIQLRLGTVVFSSVFELLTVESLVCYELKSVFC